MSQSGEGAAVSQSEMDAAVSQSGQGAFTSRAREQALVSDRAGADATAALAPRIDGAVQAVGGVRESYSARPLVARAVEHLADVNGSLAAVSETRGVRDITVCVGVSTLDDSAAVARAVASAVRAVDDDGTPTTVRVRVARLVAAAS